MTKIKNTKKGMAKKTLSMSLVVAMLATSNVPVWAAEFSDGTEATFTSEAEAPIAESNEAAIDSAKGLPTEAPEINVSSTKLSDANANGITVTTNYTVEANESICLSFVTVNEGYTPKVSETNAEVNENISKELAWSTISDSSKSYTLQKDFTSYVDQTIYCILYQYNDSNYDESQATARVILPIKVTVDSVSDYYTADVSTEQAWGTTLPTVDLSGRTNYNATLSDGAWYKNGTKVADDYTIAQNDINATFEYKATLNCGNDEFDGETVTVKTITVTGKETTNATVTWNGFTTAINNGGDLSCNYDGTAHQPTISNITLDGTTYSDVKFSYIYERSDSRTGIFVSTSDFTSKGFIKITAKVEESSAVLAGTTVTAYLEIKGIDLSTDTTVTANSLVYNGTTSFLANVTDADKAEDAGLVVTHAGKTLVCGTDYTVTATASDKNVGTEKVTITITGAGNYTGSFAKKVDIVAADLSKAEVTVNGGNAVAYTGNQVTPSVTVVLDGNTTLVKDTDYTVTYANNVNVGKDASATITGKGNYTGSITKTFEIKSSEDSWNEFLTALNSDVYDGKEISYSGSAITPVKDSYGTSTVNAIWVKGRDYEVTYSPQNINAGDVKVTITGINNYAGHSQEYTFKIVPVDITNNSDVKVEFPNITYSADLADRKAEIKAAVKVTYKGTELTLNQDYTLGDPVITADSKNVSIQITGNKNYKGSLTASADVAAKDIAGVTLPKIEAQPYTGSDYTVSIDANGNLVLQSGNNAATTYQLTDGTTPLKNANYYIVNVVNNKSVGTATINLGGKGNYTGTVSLSFPIVNQELTGTIVNKNGSTLLEDQKYSYEKASSKNGITYDDFKVWDAAGNTITADKYDVTYTENKAVGTATITVTGKEGYNLYAVNTFRIVPAKLDGITNHSLTMVTPSDYDYTGEEIKAAYTLKLTDGDYTLVEGTDYKVEYVNNVNASEGVTDDNKKPAVKVTGLGNYAGKANDGTDVVLSATFSINKVTLNATDIVAKDVSYAGGLPTTTDVTVTNSKSGKALVAGTDYTVEVTDGGTNVGPATAVIKLTTTGESNYKLDSSVNTVKYNVVANDLANATISSIEDQIATGEQIKPAITVMNGNIKLTEGTDYEVSYGDNKEVGEGTVTIKALDSNKNYTGSQTVKFNIIEEVGTPLISDVTITGNTVTPVLSGSVDGATGYDYVIATEKDYKNGRIDVSKNILSTHTNFYYVQEGTYYAYCHAWKRGEDGTKVFGGWSNLYKFEVGDVTPSTPAVESVKVSGNAVTVTYTESEDALGYDVILGTSVKKVNGETRPVDYGTLVKKNVKEGTVTVTFKNVPAGTYYAGLHSFSKTTTGTKVFSKWSNYKKVTVK